MLKLCSDSLIFFSVVRNKQLLVIVHNCKYCEMSIRYIGIKKKHFCFSANMQYAFFQAMSRKDH